MRDMKTVYDNKAKAAQAHTTHSAPVHLYRQAVSTLALIERHVKAILSDTEMWCEIYVPAVKAMRTPQMLLIEAASRVPAKAVA